MRVPRLRGFAARTRSFASNGTSRSVLLVCITALVVSAASATAATLITGKQIKDGTITSRDIKKGSISLNRLSGGVQKRVENSPVSPSPTIGGSTTPGNQTETGTPGTPGARPAPMAPTAPNGTDGTNGTNGTNGRDAAGSVFLTASNLQGFTTPTPDACGGSGTGSQSITGDTYQFDIGSRRRYVPASSTRPSTSGSPTSPSCRITTIVKHTGSGGQAPFIRISRRIPTADSATSNDDGRAVASSPSTQDGSYGTVDPSVKVAADQGAVRGRQVAGLGTSSRAASRPTRPANGGPPLDSVDRYRGPEPQRNRQGQSALAAGCGAGAWDNFVGDVGELSVGVGNVHPDCVIYQFDDGQ